MPHIRTDEKIEESTTYWHCREIRFEAIENFARFHCRNADDVNHDEVLQSSASVLGWSFADIRAWDSFERPVPLVMIDSIGSCSSTAQEPAREKVSVARRLSDETVRFMIGEENAKVLDALDAMDSVAAQVRAHADALVVTTDDEEPECLSMDWIDTEIEMCLDSGCCEHVMDLGDAPGYSVFLTESPGSKRQRKLSVGNGARVPNEGQLLLSMESSTTSGS